MEKYFTEIIGHNGDKRVEIITEEEARRHGNICAFLEREKAINFELVRQVRIKQRNGCTCGDKFVPMKGYHWTITYDAQFEDYRDRGVRVEITWKKGFGEYTGYGCRTNGMKQRCTIGKSTGWVPVYLCILTSRSMGGGSVLHSAIESIREL